MKPDYVNGAFELLGSITLWLNVVVLYRAKAIRGVHWGATAFFTCWGVWNLFYYPALGQWWSFAGGLSVMAANGTWLGLALRYRSR